MSSSQLLLGTALIIVNAVFHVSSLVRLADLLNGLGNTPQFNPNRKGLVLLLGIAVLGLIAVHTASAWAWAVVSPMVGEITKLSLALYLSIVTSTTLGYGDITLSERWQLIASFQAMGGPILSGASTAFLLAVTRSWFSHLEKPASWKRQNEAPAVDTGPSTLFLVAGLASTLTFVERYAVR